MSETVISVDKLSKAYRLGQISTGTLTHDLKRWWAKQRGKPDPYQVIGDKDHGNRQGETIWALQDISFQVEQGEVLGIIGRNGAGKSTLLKVLSEVTAPTSGEVKIKGRMSSLLEVGTGFHPDLTGRENTYLNGAILGMTRQEVRRKFDEIVDFSGVEKFIDTPVKRYSSGMYVRLAFAVAAHLEPEILVVDEVLAVGDAEFQKKCLGKMSSVAKGGRTVLFVSHNMGAIRILCPQSLLLMNGQNQGLGESAMIINRYLNLYNPADTIGMAQIPNCDTMNHSGSGEAKITSARISNAKDDPTLDFELDERILIEFGVNNPFELNLNYAVEILDQNDYPLFHFQSEYDPTVKKNDQASKNLPTVKLVIPPLFLLPDRYYLNLWTGLHTERIDKIERCFTFTIHNNLDQYRHLDLERGRILKSGAWEILYK